MYENIETNIIQSYFCTVNKLIPSMKQKTCCFNIFLEKFTQFVFFGDFTCFLSSLELLEPIETYLNIFNGGEITSPSVPKSTELNCTPEKIDQILYRMELLFIYGIL